MHHFLVVLSSWKLLHQLVLKTSSEGVESILHQQWHVQIFLSGNPQWTQELNLSLRKEPQWAGFKSRTSSSRITQSVISSRHNAYVGNKSTFLEKKNLFYGFICKERKWNTHFHIMANIAKFVRDIYYNIVPAGLICCAQKLKFGLPDPCIMFLFFSISFANA